MFETVQTHDMEWAGGSAHREGGVRFKTLFTGEAGKPDNYWFTLVEVAERYSTPAHRHNFDQVRIMLEGGFGFGAQVQPQGSVGYFAEGTYYTQEAEGPSVTLLLQAANASRARYLAVEETRAAAAALSARGRFEDGRFLRDGAPPQDGFEAVWEFVAGESVSYQKPRYGLPVIMDPARYAYIPAAGAAGAHVKHLGTFSERELRIAMLRLERGAEVDFATLWRPGERTHLLYAATGAGEADGRPWQAGSGLRTRDGGRLRASEAAELHWLTLPA